MTVMEQEVRPAGAEAPETARRPGSGISIDPARLAWYRESRSLSRAELAVAVTALGWTDLSGEPVTLKRDAINKFENPDPRWNRRPRPITLRAICAVLSNDLDGVVRPRDMLPGGPELAPHQDIADRDARLDHNTDLRDFAGRFGIPYRKPGTGRVFYSKALKDAYAAFIADDPSADELIRRARQVRPRTRRAGARHAEPSLPPETPVEALAFSRRVHALLAGEGIGTVGELTGRSEEDLLDIDHFGAGSIGEVKRVLAHARLALRDDDDDDELLAG